MRKKFMKLGSSIGIAMLFFVFLVSAEEPPVNTELEEFLLGNDLYVFTASKKVEKVSEAPGLVFAFTSDSLNHYGVFTAWDAYGLLPGMQLRHSLGTGIWTSVFARSKKWGSLSLIDGNNFGGNELIDVLSIDILKQIELISGPGGMLWGTGSSMGVVNIITKSGADIQGIKIKQDIGTQGYRTNVSVGNKKDKLEYLVNVNYWDRKEAPLKGDKYVEGYLSGSSPAPRWAEKSYETKTSDDRLVSLFTKVGWHDFTLTLLGAGDKDYWPISARGDVISSKESTEFQGKIDMLNYVHALDYKKQLNDNLLLQTKFSHSYEKTRDWSLIHYKPTVGLPYPQRVDINAFYLETVANAQLLWTKNKILAWYDNELLVSTEWREVQNRDSKLRTYSVVTGTAGSWSDPTTTKRIQQSQLLQNNFKFLANKIRAQIGVRYEHPNDYADEIIPKYALIFSPTDRLTAKVMYHKGWKAPQQGWWNITIKEKIPEYTVSNDAEVSYKISKNVRSRIAYSKVKITGDTETRLNPATGNYETFVADAGAIRSVFFDLNTKFDTGLESFFNYTYNRPRSTSSTKPGWQLNIEDKFTARQMANLGLYYPCCKQIGLSSLLKYTGEKTFFSFDPTYTGADKLGNKSPRIVKGFVTIALGLTYTKNNWVWDNRIYNAFDKKYEEPSDVIAIPGLGRTFLTSVAVKF